MKKAKKNRIQKYGTEHILASVIALYDKDWKKSVTRRINECPFCDDDQKEELLKDLEKIEKWGMIKPEK